MKIGVLTSSRADFGIYLPLLKALDDDDFFDLELIVFGTHLSSFHGNTLNQIKKHDFKIIYAVDSLLLGDSEDAIATSIGLTTIKFSSFWKEHRLRFDFVICLGDRYEMFAAIMAGVPFQLKFIHFHGGEKTLGAIDNIFRHSISHASAIHFTSTEFYADRLRTMLDNKDNIYNVGSMSLQNMKEIDLINKQEFFIKWNVDLNRPTILMTFHPETLNSLSNRKFALELVSVIELEPHYQFLITMPNSDTAGNEVRQIFKEKLSSLSKVCMIENLGTAGYFSAMAHCSFLLGNTSSGIIEAASFGKMVINIGNRQQGRLTSGNVVQVPISREAIQKAISVIRKNEVFRGQNIYFQENPVSNVMSILKSLSTNV